MIIGPRETFSYTCVLHLKGLGPFESTIELYLEQNGIRKVELVVRGTTEGQPNAKIPEP